MPEPCDAAPVRNTKRTWTSFVSGWLPGLRQASGKAPGKLAVLGRLLLPLVAAHYLATFVFLAGMRIPDQIEHDWLEGCLVTQVQRILAGLPLYAEPSIDYVPVLYGPLYPWVCAGVARVFGVGYETLRLVSFAATLGAMALIALLVRRMNGSWLAAWVAAGFYAGMYAITAFGFDNARVDSLFVFCALAAFLGMLSVATGGWPAALFTAGSAACAILAKQTALLPMLGLCLWALTRPDRMTRRTAWACAVAIAFTQVVAVWITDGWFVYYVYVVSGVHPMLKSNVEWFVRHFFLQRLIFGFAASLLVLTLLLRSRTDRRNAIFLLVLLLTMVAAGLVPLFGVGGYVNNLIPVAAALAVGAGLLFNQSRTLRGGVAVLSLVLLLGFAFQVRYPPSQGMPTAGQQAQTRRVSKVFEKMEGPVWAPCNGYVASLSAAGRTTHAFWPAMFDLMITPGPERELLRTSVTRALEEQRFAAVVLNRHFYMDDSFPFDPLLRNYRECRQMSNPAYRAARRAKMKIYVRRDDTDLPEPERSIPPQADNTAGITGFRAGPGFPSSPPPASPAPR